VRVCGADVAQVFISDFVLNSAGAWVSLVALCSGSEGGAR
jgi:hypothetical protein